MNTIDFHMHIFPEHLAYKAMSSLSERAKTVPYTDGRLNDTLRILDEWNTEYAVSLNIAVLPKNIVKVNDFAISSNGGRIISFGSAHPYSDIWREELIRLRENGIKGIKLHPEYQEFDADDPKALELYKFAGELDLIVLLHAGTDIAYPETLRSSPKAIMRASEQAPEVKFVAAHYGGHECWEDVYRYLAGNENIWLDTAYIARELEPELFLKIADKHGIKRILYATDCPWESGIITQEYLNNMGYNEEQLEDIMFNNAFKLLGGF